MFVEFPIRFPTSINPLTKLVHFVLVILYRNFLSFFLLRCIFARFSPRFSFPMSCIQNPVAPFLLVFLSILSILLCFPPLSAIAMAPSSTSSKILAVLEFHHKIQARDDPGTLSSPSNPAANPCSPSCWQPQRWNKHNPQNLSMCFVKPRNI